ncbi:MAG TPA: conjugative transfer signal peptidase TraF [Candidatus Baltobacteraceae bacterium]|jgi:conjugative transfer signal peptidase TraF|nr:conjugative transfer signal peptidase TraF [Candidatus Baltobacteraceae bacterium]
MRRARVVAFIVLAGVCAGTAMLWPGARHAFALNVTPSMPIGIYRIEPVRGPIRRGSLVAVCLGGPYAQLAARRGYASQGSCARGEVALIKEVAGIPGDTVVQDVSHVAINGRDLASSRSFGSDSRGRSFAPLPASQFRLPPHYIWLYSARERGFDSRYFGPVPDSDVIGLGRALWTLR